MSSNDASLAKVGKTSESIRVERNRVKKALMALALSIVMALSMFGCSGGKPSDMDQETYDKATEAIEVAENCLSGKTSQSDANAKLDSIYSQLEAYTPDNSTNHTLVSSTVLNMVVYTDPIAETNEEKLQDQIDTLKGYFD